MERQRIIIIGGGISGLVAARQLAEKFDVTVLEALPQFGGRIRTIKDARSGMQIEGGAEFVHGEAKNTLALLAEAGLQLKKIEGEHYQKQGRELVKSQESDEDWQQLMDKMAEVTEDMTLQVFLDQYFRGKQWSALRRRVIAFAGGFDLADKDRVSVKALFMEWAHQGEDHHIEGGYGKLIDFLVGECTASGCKLVSREEVLRVNWSAGAVQVYTRSQQEYRADKCLVTLPLGILQRKTISFSPKLERYEQAVQQIGFGTVVKVVLVFKIRLWKEDTGFIFSDEVIPTWWPQGPEEAPVLTGWAGGPKGNLLEGYNDQKLLAKAVSSVAAIFNLSVAEIEAQLAASYVFNWKKEPTVRGAYSYSTPDSPAAVELLNTPVADTLYFAGEACYTGPNPGTVEAALSSALEIVKAIDCRPAR